MAAALVVASTFMGCATDRQAAVAPEPAPRSDLPPAYAVETFDIVWKTVEEQHFDRTFNGLDWTALRAEFRPRVDDVRSDEELRALLEEMLGRLGQSHFGIIPASIADVDTAGDPEEPDESAVGDIGVLLRRVEGRVVTVAPDPLGPAAQAGILAGWELIEVDGRAVHTPPLDASDEASSLARYAIENWAARRAATAAGSSRELVFLDESGERRTVTITALALGGQVVRFGNLPAFETKVLDRRVSSEEFAMAELDAADATNRSIAYIAFNVWMIPAARAIDLAVDRHRDADALIIDLRGNPGGLGGMAMGVGGHFFVEPVSLGTMTTRSGELEFRVNPRRVTGDGRLVEPFAGPIAILIDPLTASTSEIFAAGLQEAGRARVFGQTSAGAALPSIAARLPNGDVFQYAMADFVTPAGVRIEGRGVVPDEPITLTRERLRRERDPVLADALRWLVSQPVVESAASESVTH